MINMAIKKCTKFGVIAGRVVVCKAGELKGQELFMVRKESGFSPTQADAMTHYVVKGLNKSQDFDKFYNRYMKS